MTNSTASGPGDLLSGLLKYNEESQKVNNKGSLYGPYASLLNNPLNPLYGQFYVGDKLGQGVKNAWQKKDIGAFFNANFFHIYGYKNLDKVWGGKNVKKILEGVLNVDSHGNVSIGGALLDLTYLIPVGGEAELAARLGLTGVSKFGVGIAESLLSKKTVQMLSTSLSGRWKQLKSLISPILNKIPGLKNLDPAKAWDYAVKSAGLITLKPSTIMEIFGKTSVGKWISGKLGQYGGSAVKYSADLLKAIHDGPSETLKFVLEMLTKIPGVKATTSTIKRFLERNSVYEAFKTVHDAYGEIKKEGIRKYVGDKIEKYSNIAHGVATHAYKVVHKAATHAYNIAHGVATHAYNVVHKAASHIYRAANHIYHRVYRAARHIYHRVYRAARHIYHRVYRAASHVYHHYIQPVINTVSSWGHSAWNAASNAWHSIFGGPAGISNSSTSFKSRESGFTYQGYTGSRKTIAQTISSMSGNCVDGTLAQVALAQSFGIPAQMVKTTWNGNPHVYGRINGVDRDVANHALTGSWSAPPAGPDQSDAAKEVHVHIEGDVYGPEFEDKVGQILTKKIRKGIRC